MTSVCVAGQAVTATGAVPLTQMTSHTPHTAGQPEETFSRDLQLGDPGSTGYPQGILGGGRAVGWEVTVPGSTGYPRWGWGGGR